MKKLLILSILVTLFIGFSIKTADTYAMPTAYAVPTGTEVISVDFDYDWAHSAKGDLYITAGVDITIKAYSTASTVCVLEDFSQTTLIEDYDATVINHYKSIDQSIYWIEEEQKFTFSEIYYDLYVQVETLVDNAHDDGYATGYSTGFTNGAQLTYAEAFAVGRQTGRNDVFVAGSQFYGFTLADSFDYKRGLADYLATASDVVATAIYNNGFDGYFHDETGLAIDETLSHSYLQGILAGDEASYDRGYIDGGNDAFTAKLDSWIVPAIITVLFFGGLISIISWKRKASE